MVATTRGAPAWIGIGSNLDDPERQVRSALLELDGIPGCRVGAVSRLYRTPPWGVSDQPDFINAVALLETTLEPVPLLAELIRIERAHGRDRSGPRWGPRVLDLDLLLHADHVIDTPGLTVPHPQISARAFVLVPLAEIAPELDIPGLGKVGDLLRRIDTRDCRPLDAAA